RSSWTSTSSPRFSKRWKRIGLISIYSVLRLASDSTARRWQRDKIGCTHMHRGYLFGRLVRWCNGSTEPFGGFSHGSNPCRTAKFLRLADQILILSDGFPLSCSLPVPDQ